MRRQQGAADRLSLRALNRATLARQLLLERSDMPALDAVRHLVGMQAQLPMNPYVGLWSRLAGFQPEQLSRMLLDRKVVRIVVMRATLHLVTAADCLVLRPLLQPVVDRELARHPEYGPALRGVDLDPVLAFARSLLAERPRTGSELRSAMAERFPDFHAGALAYACRCLLALVQVPPRGVWGRSAQVTSTTAESWLGRPLAAAPSIDDVVLRYFAAFGPAAVADVAAWSALTALREVVERLRPRLRSFRDDRGRELFDLPDAPRPDPDTPSPPRFLPEFDNVLLSHADRSRFVSEDHRARLRSAAAPVRGSLLVDGAVCGTWSLHDGDGTVPAALVTRHVRPLTDEEGSGVAAEGTALLRFHGHDAGQSDVRFLLP